MEIKEDAARRSSSPTISTNAALPIGEATLEMARGETPSRNPDPPRPQLGRDSACRREGKRG